jgi:hypothetical protein
MIEISFRLDKLILSGKCSDCKRKYGSPLWHICRGNKNAKT